MSLQDSHLETLTLDLFFDSCLDRFGLLPLSSSPTAPEPMAELGGPRRHAVPPGQRVRRPGEGAGVTDPLKIMLSQTQGKLPSEVLRGYFPLSPCCYIAPCWNLLAVPSRHVLCVPSGTDVLSEGLPDSSDVKLERWSVMKDNTGSIFIFQREQRFLQWGTGDMGLFLYSVMLKIVLILYMDVMATVFFFAFAISLFLGQYFLHVLVL